MFVDRLLHHSHVLTIRGDCYRLREKRRSGLLSRSGLKEGAEGRMTEGVSFRVAWGSDSDGA